MPPFLRYFCHCGAECEEVFTGDGRAIVTCPEHGDIVTITYGVGGYEVHLKKEKEKGA